VCACDLKQLASSAREFVSRDSLMLYNSFLLFLGNVSWSASDNAVVTLHCECNWSRSSARSFESDNLNNSCSFIIEESYGSVTSVSSTLASNERLRIDPLAAHASVTSVQGVLLRRVRSHTTVRRQSMVSARVQGLPAGVILQHGWNNGKNRLGSFSWSQGPREVHCRNFPLLYLHSSDVPLNAGIPFLSDRCASHWDCFGCRDMVRVLASCTMRSSWSHFHPIENWEEIICSRSMNRSSAKNGSLFLRDIKLCIKTQGTVLQIARLIDRKLTDIDS